MEIPAKVSFWLNIVYGISVALSTGFSNSAGILTDKETTAVVAYAGALAFVLNLVLHGYSAPSPGPLSKSAKRMGITLFSAFLLVLGYGLHQARAADMTPIPDEENGEYTPIPEHGFTPVPLRTERRAPHQLALTPRKHHQGGGAWINPRQFPNVVPLPPINNPFSPAPTPVAPKDPIAAILNAVAQAQATIVADLNTANTLATTPKPVQTAAACVSPATWTPGQAATPAAALNFNASILGTELIVTIPPTNGILAIGESVTDPQGLVLPGTIIIAGSPGSWTVNNTQTVANIPMQIVTSPAVPAIPASCNPPEIWDPLGAACFPAMANFVQSLPGPGSLPTIPNSKGGLVTVAEDARILDFALKQFTAQIGTVGYPDSLKIACDPWLLDWVTQANLDLTKLAGLGLSVTGAGGLMNALLLKFVPMPVAAAHGLAGAKRSLFNDAN